MELKIRKRCTEPNAKETDQETGGLGQDVDVICGIDELSQFFQDAGFTETPSRSTVSMICEGGHGISTV